MNENWYVVDNLEEFILSTRKLVFNNFGKQDQSEPVIDNLILDIKQEEQEEFDAIITQEECTIIAKNLMRKQINKHNNKTRYLLTDHIYMQILEDINSRMVSNILNGLVNKGILESGFDETENDFIFWIKPDVKDKEIPETD